MTKVICTEDSKYGAAGRVYAQDPDLAMPAQYSPLLTWADWELLQELHKERAEVEVAPEPSQADGLESEIATLRLLLKQAAVERDRALVQVTVYRKAYYNLRDVTASGQTMADAARIIHEQVTECENK